MRIGLTNYYSTVKHTYGTNPETKRTRPMTVECYVLSVYNTPRQYAYDMIDEMRTYGIYGRYKCFIGEDIPLPHILIENTESVQKLEKLFKRQGIELPEDRFAQKTNWEEVLRFEENRKKIVHQKQKKKTNKSFFHRIAARLGR